MAVTIAPETRELAELVLATHVKDFAGMCAGCIHTRDVMTPYPCQTGTWAAQIVAVAEAESYTAGKESPQ